MLKEIIKDIFKFLKKKLKEISKGIILFIFNFIIVIMVNFIIFLLTKYPFTKFGINKITAGYMNSLLAIFSLSYRKKNFIFLSLINTTIEGFCGENTSFSNKISNYIERTNFRKYCYLLYLVGYIIFNFIKFNDTGKVVQVLSLASPYINKENLPQIITTFFFYETYMITFNNKFFEEK